MSKSALEEDPLYLQMINRSHILKKVDDLKVPLIKKQRNIKHQTFTTITLSTAIYFIIYPLDTIKNRVISKHKTMDIANFTKNKVQNLTIYLGLFRGYGPVLISNLTHLTIGKYSLVASTIAQGMIKTFLQISKISKQMGNSKGDFSIMKKSLPICMFYGIMRDLIYRGIFFNLMKYQHEQQLKHARFYDERKKMNIMYGAILLGTLISHPLDVCFTKVASQRQLKYTNIFQIPKTIFRQQSIGKLMLSGFWARTTYNLVSTFVMAATYQQLLGITLQVF